MDGGNNKIRRAKRQGEPAARCLGPREKHRYGLKRPQRKAPANAASRIKNAARAGVRMDKVAAYLWPTGLAELPETPFPRLLPMVSPETTKSTRRFLALPAAVSFEAIGPVSPRP